MKLKQIISIVIVIAALAGAGVFAYMSLKSEVDTATQATSSEQQTAIILPHGNELNFDQVNKYNQTGQQFQYPQTTAADTGLQLNEIISQQ